MFPFRYPAILTLDSQLTLWYLLLWPLPGMHIFRYLSLRFIFIFSHCLTISLPNRLSVMFVHQNCVCIPCLLHPQHMPDRLGMCLGSLSKLYLATSTSNRSFLEYPNLFAYSILNMYFLSTLFWNTCNLCPLRVIVHTHTNARDKIILHILILSLLEIQGDDSSF